ncbi:MAG: hypothetical protein DMG07_01485 [Acidobacteria bacterium]|nr:MAG: hypothetical protein DMG07_01485 [Acidobacteriota bacterium]
MVRGVATAATAVLAVAARLLSQEPGAADRAKLDRWPYSLALPEVAREEISFPPVAGFQVLKGDFHVHTFYSDGLVSPEVRVVEAWRDGLDVLALTDHSEYLDVAIPYDRERAYGRALPVAKQLGLLLARGAELSQISSSSPTRGSCSASSTPGCARPALRARPWSGRIPGRTGARSRRPSPAAAGSTGSSSATGCCRGAPARAGSRAPGSGPR